MRRLLPLSLFALLSLSPIAVTAQDSTAEEVQSSAEKILSDPRLQDLMRSAKNDPEAMVDQVKSDPGAAVDEATRLFQESLQKVDTSSIDTPENRAKAKALSSAALSRANELAKKKAEEAKLEKAETKALKEEASAPAPAPKPTPAPAPAPKPTPAPAPTSSGGAALGKVTGAAAGGKVLPKEELNPEVLKLLKK